METVPECFNYIWLKVEKRKISSRLLWVGKEGGGGMPFGAADAMCENALQSGQKERGGGRS